MMSIAERRKTRESGFTLLELLLVVAIIATLSAIVTPLFFRHLNQVRTVRAILEIRQFEAQLTNFRNSNGRLPDLLAQLGTVLKDPWGQPYQYTLIEGKPLSGADKVRPRKNRFLHPLNSDYDLYSFGPDGQSQLALTAKASHDDIIRANDGAYIGLAKFY